MGPDEFLYEKASKEWASSAKPGLKAKCIAKAGGRDAGEALYINTRVEKWKRKYQRRLLEEEYLRRQVEQGWLKSWPEGREEERLREEAHSEIHWDRQEEEQAHLYGDED